MRAGLFITFEGGEGSGKTTQIKKMARWLKKEGYPVVITREPGGTFFADWIRKILLDKKNKGIDPFIELLLYEAARQDHVRQVIEPQLKRGKIILCDRFTDATVAYQGYGRRLPLPLVKKLNELACKKIKPDKTFLFQLPLKVGLGRVRKRKGKMNRLDRESELFHGRVKEGYDRLAAQERKRFLEIAAAKKPEEVFRELQKAMREILP